MQTHAVQEEWRRKPVVMPLTQAFPQFKDVREFRSRNVIFNQDCSRLFNVVSRTYRLVDHEETVNMITLALTSIFGAAPKVTVRSFAGGARIRAEFELVGAKPIEVLKGDFVHPRVVMLNAHDGMWKFVISLGGWRQVCSNGLMVGVKLASLSSKHVSALGDASQFSERIGDMLARFPLLAEVWKEWSETEVEYEFAARRLDGVFPKKHLDQILQPSQFPKTKWALYNDLTAVSTHQTKSVNRRVEFDLQIAKIFYEDDYSPTMEKFVGHSLPAPTVA